MLDLSRARRAPAYPASLRTESLGGGAALSHAGGEVAGRLAPIAIEPGRRLAIFELRVDNGTAAPVAAFAYPLGRSGDVIDWHASIVPPFSAIAVRVDLPYDRRRPQGAVAHVLSHDTSLTLEAAPPMPARRTPLRRARVVATAAVALAAGGAVLTSLRPSVLALVAPERVTMGRPFAVAYASAQSPTLRFVARTPDGLVVRRGELAAASGTFALALPLTSRGMAYDVELDARSSLGADERTVRVAAGAPPPAGDRRRAKIDAFALASDTVAGGAPIVVNYRTTARTGVVELLDQFGTERASALLSHRGRSTLIAPAVAEDEDFRIVLTANAASASDTAAAPVHVTPAAPATATLAETRTLAEAGAPERSAGVRATRAEAAGPIVRGAIGLVSSRLGLGQRFVIRVLHAERDMRIAIDDADGTELSAMRPARGRRRVVMRAPDLPADYTLVATYARGISQESVVVPLRVGDAARASREP